MSVKNRAGLGALVMWMGLAVAAMPAGASSVGSSASDSLSTSVGSFSDSIENSSKSSTGDDKVAEGDYRVVDVAALDERAGTLRLTLQATGVAGDGEFFLYVPRKAFEQGRLARGEVVTARDRSYGMEFARADNREPFFLVMKDGLHRELASHPVVL